MGIPSSALQNHGYQGGEIEGNVQVESPCLKTFVDNVNKRVTSLDQVIKHSKNARSMPPCPYPLGHSITKENTMCQVIKCSHWKVNPHMKQGTSIRQ